MKGDTGAAGQLAAPAGVILPFAGTAVPLGWLICDGSEKKQSQYPDLFSAIGRSYGAGDGVSTFNVPDLRGRVAVGADNMGGTGAGRVTSAASGIDGATLGTAGGEEVHTLSVGELAVHAHNIWAQGGAPGSHYSVTGAYSNAGNTDPSLTAGSGLPHNNMQPSLIVNYIIKY